MERVENGKDGKKFIALPNEISKMSDEQIDHWAMQSYDALMDSERKPLLLQPFETYGPSTNWPRHVQIAEIIRIYFPDTYILTSMDGQDFRYSFFSKKENVLNIDQSTWAFPSGAPGGSWEGWYEGGPVQIAELILQELANEGYRVYRPHKYLDLENPPTSKQVRRRKLHPSDSKFGWETGLGDV
jgi:hypothetical protein